MGYLLRYPFTLALYPASCLALFEILVAAVRRDFILHRCPASGLQSCLFVAARVEGPACNPGLVFRFMHQTLKIETRAIQPCASLPDCSGAQGQDQGFCVPAYVSPKKLVGVGIMCG